jgi:hypothetical protein
VPLTKPPTQVRYLEPEELAKFAVEVIPSDDDNETGDNAVAAAGNNEAAVSAVEPNTAPAVVVIEETVIEETVIEAESITATVVEVTTVEVSAEKKPRQRSVKNRPKVEKAAAEIPPQPQSDLELIPQQEPPPAAPKSTKKKSEPVPAAATEQKAEQIVEEKPVKNSWNSKSKAGKTVKSGDDANDEFGIIQPEFGF